MPGASPGPPASGLPAARALADCQAEHPSPRADTSEAAPQGLWPQLRNGAPQQESAALGGRWNPMNAP